MPEPTSRTDVDLDDLTDAEPRLTERGETVLRFELTGPDGATIEAEALRVCRAYLNRPWLIGFDVELTRAGNSVDEVLGTERDEPLFRAVVEARPLASPEALGGVVMIGREVLRILTEVASIGGTVDVVEDELDVVRIAREALAR